MSESKHKGDKWYVGGNGRDVLQFDDKLDKGQLIAVVASYVYSEGYTSQGPETARLIAAAPDLLEALQYVLSAHGEQLTDAFERAHKAISKATGEAT